MKMKNMKQTFVFSLILIILGGGCNLKKEQSRPNVLFIAIDDLRPELGCYGNSKVVSPNIDGLAEQGILFENNYCQVPVCGASRSSLLTGLRPTEDRFKNKGDLPCKAVPGIATMPEHFKNNGYHVAGLGKIFHKTLGCSEVWSKPPYSPPFTGNWRNYQLDESKKIAQANQGWGPPTEAAEGDDLTYQDGHIAKNAIQELRYLGKDNKPFFLAVGLNKPHTPFTAPKKYWDLIDVNELRLANNQYLPENAPDDAIYKSGEQRAYTGVPNTGEISDSLQLHLIHGYYACLAYADHLVGKILHELEAQGLVKNTIVVLWGDHGYQLGEHGLWAKHCNFENALRSPLIMKLPGHKGGIKEKRITEFVDLYPTLIELCGIKPPKHELQGRDLMPLIKNAEIEWKEGAFSRWKDGYSFKNTRYRYTEYSKEGKVYAKMLYDHQNDPNENVNVAEKTEYKEVATELSSVLKKDWKVYFQ